MLGLLRKSFELSLRREGLRPFEDLLRTDAEECLSRETLLLEEDRFREGVRFEELERPAREEVRLVDELRAEEDGLKVDGALDFAFAEEIIARIDEV